MSNGRVAWFWLSSVAVARVTLPAVKVTVTPGVPLPGDTAQTQVVKVPDCPNSEGSMLEGSVTLLEVLPVLLFAVCVGLPELLEKSLVAPASLAKMG